MKLSNLFSKGSAIFLKLNIILFLLLLFNHPTTVFSLPSGNNLERSVHGFEFLSYRADYGKTTFLEMFSQISTNNLIFVRSKDGFFASYELSIAIYDQFENQVVETRFVDSVRVKTFGDIDQFRPPKLFRLPLFLEPGEYKARLQFADLETRIPWDFQKDITIPEYNNAQLQLSDLQIASSISASNEKNSLVKNGMEVIPNVLRVVETGWDKIHVYSEIYDLRYSLDKPNDEFIASYVIENKKGKAVKTYNIRRKKPGDTCALSVGLPVQELAEGEYRLILTVEDPAQARTVSKSINFYVAGPHSESYL